MAENTIIEPQEPSEAQKRITQLSDKVRTTSEERDEKNRLLKESTEKIATLERENTFNSGFVDVLSTHTAAKDHRDDIKAKVLSTGMSVEDAAYAVLGKAGKLGGTHTSNPTHQVAGSTTAPNNPQISGEKKVAEMTQAERRDALSKDLMWS